MFIWPGIIPVFFLIALSASMMIGTVSVLIPHIRLISIYKSLLLLLLLLLLLFTTPKHNL